MMKNVKTFLLAATALFFVACTSSEDHEGSENLEIPEAVLANFNETFPDAANIEWLIDGEEYEAEFTVEDREYEVVYDASGNMLEAELDIEIDELPMLAQDYIAENHPGIEIDELKKISNNEGNFYEVEFEENNMEVELIFNVNGEFVEAILEEEEKASEEAV